MHELSIHFIEHLLGTRHDMKYKKYNDKCNRL